MKIGLSKKIINKNKRQEIQTTHPKATFELFSSVLRTSSDQLLKPAFHSPVPMVVYYTICSDHWADSFIPPLEPISTERLSVLGTDSHLNTSDEEPDNCLRFSDEQCFSTLLS